MKHNRRTFLKGLATAGVISPLAYTLARPAFAAEGECRFLNFFIPNGCVPRLWFPTGGETDFTLPEMSAPLEVIRQHLVFLQGINVYNAGPTHEGVDTLLTGGADQSLDIFLGQQLAGVTPFESIQLGIGSNFQSEGSVHYIGPGQTLKPDDDPISAFDRIFGNFTPPDSGSSGPTIAQLRQQSIIDTSVESLDRLRTRLGADEKAKLDIHLDSIREVERRIGGGAATACESISWNEEGFQNDPTVFYPLTYEDPVNHETVAKLQMDLALLALACDMTRVASVMLMGNVSEVNIPSSPVNGNYHSITHYSDANTADFVQLRHWTLEKFIYLIQRMQETPLGSGTLLDASLVFMSTEISDGILHNHCDMPFVLAGRAGGRLQTGRYLDYRRDPSITCATEAEPHNKLLVSIAQAMGVQLDSYGYTAAGTGPLEGLLG